MGCASGSSLRSSLYYTAGHCFVLLRKNARAVAEFRRCVTQQPTHVQAWRMIGFLSQQAGLDAEAALAFGRALELAPDDAATCFNRGFLLHRMQQLEAALAHMQDATRLDPSLDQAWYGSGLILAALGRHAASAGSLEQAVRLQPFNGAASIALCRAYRQSGDEEKLLAEYRRISEFDPPAARQLCRELGPGPGHPAR
jgi:tetratricopeptide (TPR) repeat protein